MKHISLYSLAFLFLVGVFLGAIRIYEWYQNHRTPEQSVTVTPNPLHRDVSPLVEESSGQALLLRSALNDPEAVVHVDTPGDSGAKPIAPEIPRALVTPPSRSEEIESPATVAPAPEAEATRRIYDSFVSLRMPRVGDPRSPENVVLLENMLNKGADQSRRPPISKP